MKISVADGKYTFYTKENDDRIYCDRYDNKEWMIFSQGSNSIRALMVKAESLENQVKALNKENYTLNETIEDLEESLENENTYGGGCQECT